MNTPNTTTSVFNVLGQTAFSENSFVPLEVKGMGLKNFKLNTASRNASMDRYNKFAQDYNERIPAKNKDILKYNANVICFVEQNGLTSQHQKANGNFKRAMHHVSINEYNEAAKLQNKLSGKLLITLKKHTSIKLIGEKIFKQILFEYTRQIEDINAINAQIGNYNPRALQKVKINLHKVTTNQKEDGTYYLKMSTKALQNHLKRFIESGVLLAYEFCGYYHNKTTGERKGKPSKYFVNNQILVLFDWKTKKMLSLENQHFKYSEKTNVPNNKPVTRTYINKKEIIEPVNKQSLDKEIESLSGILSKMKLSEKDNNGNINGNTIQRMKPLDTENTTAPNFKAVTQTKMADFLLNNIEDRQTMLEKFSEGHYKSWRFYERAPKNSPYAVLSLQHLEYEEHQGIIFKDDYLQILHQVLFKMCGPIYRKSNNNGVFNYVGPAYHGYEALKNLLLNNNGTVPTKKIALTRFKGLLWRLKFAANYYNSKSITPLFINDYLDPTRTTKKEGGFAYTLNIYKNHLELSNFKEKTKTKKQIQHEKAKVRKQKMKAIELVEKQINNLKNGKTSIIKLHDYVSNNAHIPQSIKNKLPDYIKRAYSC